MRIFTVLLVMGCLACTGTPKGFHVQLKGDFINVVINKDGRGEVRVKRYVAGTRELFD